MTTLSTRPTAGTTAVPRRPGHWIDDWRPEDPQFWERTGRRVARRNLLFSIFTEHVGFSVWVLWSVFVLFLPGGQYGISTDPIEAAAQKFLLTSLPSGLGSAVRIPYNLAVARFGGRNWTVISALLLLVPTVSAAIWLTPDASFGTLLVLSAITGLGGGNFASSMTNINAFYPQRLKGWALGLNAGGGNLGVAVVQIVGLVVLSTAGAAHPRAILAIYIPLIVIGAVGAALTMDNLSQARNDKRAMRDAMRDPHTWVMSFLYIGTFGSFIGFGFAFGQVLSTQFATHFAGAVNSLSSVPATKTPLSDALFHTTWFKNPAGGFYWDTLHHRAVPVSSVTNPLDPSLHLLKGKLDATYAPDPTAAPVAVRIGHKVDAAKVAWLTFLGPLIGSLVRPVGGALADRLGGARTTFVTFALMALAGGVVLVASHDASLPLFMVGFVALFVLSGVGNGSTYKMIPSIFRSKAATAVAEGADPDAAAADARRLSGALIGIAGAIGAFGGVLVNVAFRQSFLHTGTGNAAYVAFIAFYVACLLVTWFVYLRPSRGRLADV
ncbi:MAG: MFS transporter [Jatrophihabitans sp.]|uniref:MFS transporter n=1 Tax=Jatrophihabitans sp. TaxID=1932789 RepID=UPI003F81AF5D